MKKILVTGGSGFIGSHLCDRLVREGHHVICMDNFETSNGSNISHLMDKENFIFVKNDVINTYEYDIDEIYNLACPASPIAYQKDPIHTLRTSIWGIFNAIECAKKCHAKILQASTSEVYGSPLVHPQSETYWGNVNPNGIRSCYDEGKRAAETMLMDADRQGIVKGRIVRIFNTYGPNMDEHDGRVISNFIYSSLRGEDITIYGDGTQTRSFQYIDDLIEGLIKVMNNEEIDCSPINLGNPEEYTMNELAELIIDLTKTSSTIIYKELPQDDPPQRKPNIDKAISLLEWKPLVNVTDGLTKTIKYFKQLQENE